MKWETVIGLEVHAELSTNTKIFCGCPTDFGARPNTQVCPVCSGMPGALPRLNRAVVDYALKLGLSLGCDITRHTTFDRKNYTYPDLPSAYQTTQFYFPICRGGSVEIEVRGEKKSVGIHQIHMEEDAGKLIHDPKNGQTYMDFNRSSMPLLEIVSKPDMRSAEEVIAYLERLRETLLYLGICDCKMQEGSFRVDVNLSIRPPGGEDGTRTETKNINSFKAITRAIEYETARQIEVLSEGGKIVQETRRWDDDLGESYGMRSKENAQDYRYFPDPNIPPVIIDEAWLAKTKSELPELAHEKRARYVKNFGVTPTEAVVLTNHKNISDLFETLAEKTNETAESAHLITGEIMRLLNATGTLPEDLKIDADKLASLIGLVLGGKINRNAYKETVEAVFLHNTDPMEYIEEHGLMMVSDSGAVEGIVAEVMKDNPGAVEDYRAGKQQAFGFLVGQVMKKLAGAGNPAVVREVLEKAIKQ